MKHTYLPQYVHSNLEDGKITLKINITSDTSEENYAHVTRFCNEWKDDPEDHYTFLDVNFDIQQIIEDALYMDRDTRRKYKFNNREDMEFLVKLQAELIKALAAVNQAMIECNAATA